RTWDQRLPCCRRIHSPFPGAGSETLRGGAAERCRVPDGHRPGWAVQHESTATDADLHGLGGTPRDGDLRGWTLVDGLPVVCKQGVRGSSPLSSTPSSD